MFFRVTVADGAGNGNLTGIIQASTKEDAIQQAVVAVQPVGDISDKWVPLPECDLPEDERLHESAVMMLHTVEFDSPVDEMQHDQTPIMYIEEYTLGEFWEDGE